MVLFDKGDKILKTVEFQKSPAEWIYQLQHASDVPDRADAAKALGDEKGNDAAAAALGEAALHDPFWGVRDESLLALGRIGSGDAEKGVIAALANSEPWVREQAVTQLGHFRDDSRWLRGWRRFSMMTPPIASALPRWARSGRSRPPTHAKRWRPRPRSIRPMM